MTAIPYKARVGRRTGISASATPIPSPWMNIIVSLASSVVDWGNNICFPQSFQTQFTLLQGCTKECHFPLILQSYRSSTMVRFIGAKKNMEIHLKYSSSALQLCKPYIIISWYTLSSTIRYGFFFCYMFYFYLINQTGLWAAAKQKMKLSASINVAVIKVIQGKSSLSITIELVLVKSNKARCHLIRWQGGI